MTFSLFWNTSFAIDKDLITEKQSLLIQNTQVNISHAQIIENETLKFEKRLLNIQKNYNLIDDWTINKHIKDLREIIYILKKIQTNRINKSTADNVIAVVIGDLRNINIQVKSYLHQFQKIDKEKINKYTIIVLKISHTFDKLLVIFSNYYENKNNNDTNHQNILEELQKIKILNISLKKLTKNTYVYSSHYKDDIVVVIKKLRLSLLQIKKYSHK